MNNALSAIKAAIGNNFDVAVQYEFGKGHVSMIVDEIRSANQKLVALDGSVSESFIEIPVLENGVAVCKVPEELLEADVIIIGNLGSFTAEDTMHIDSLINDRKIHEQSFNSLKSVIILNETFEEMIAEVEMRETKRPIILASF